MAWRRRCYSLHSCRQYRQRELKSQTTAVERWHAALHSGCTVTTNTRHSFLSSAPILLFTPTLLLGILVPGGTSFTLYVLGISMFQRVSPLTEKDGSRGRKECCCRSSAWKGEYARCCSLQRLPSDLSSAAWTLGACIWDTCCPAVHTKQWITIK